MGERLSKISVTQFEQGTARERVDVDPPSYKLERDDNGEFFRRISSLELRTTLLRVYSIAVLLL